MEHGLFDRLFIQPRDLPYVHMGADNYQILANDLISYGFLVDTEYRVRTFNDTLGLRNFICKILHTALYLHKGVDGFD